MGRVSTALLHGQFRHESSYGVEASASTYEVPWAESIEFEPTRAALQPRYLTADRYLRKPVAGEHSVAGGMNCVVGPENFTKFFFGMFSHCPISACTSVYGGTACTQHTFKFGTTQISFEGIVDKGNHEDFLRGGWIRGADFSVDRNAILKCALDMQWQQVATTDVLITPTISTLDPFTDMKGNIEREDAAVTDMDGFSLRINTGTLDFKRFGSPYVTDIVPGKAEVSAELACAFADATEFRRFLGNASGSNQQAVGEVYDPLKLEWTFQTGEDADPGWGAGSPYSLKFTAYASYYEVFPQGIASDSEILRSRPTILIRYDATGGCELQVDLINTMGWSEIVY